MNNDQSFQRFAALTAIASFVLLVIAGISMQPLSTNFGPEVFTNPVVTLSVGADGANLWRGAMIVDMFAYYLMLLPIALFLWRWFGLSNPTWIRFYTLCGLGYILIGAIGAVILAAVQPPLIIAYSQAPTEQREIIETVFRTIWNMVYGGMWNILEVLLAGIWFFGVGVLLRDKRRVFSISSMIVGISAILDSLGNILDIETLASVASSIYIILVPIWTLWFGIDLLRRPVEIQTVSQNRETP